MTPEDPTEWERLNTAWIRRSLCEAIDECVAKLVALQELVATLPETPTLGQCERPKVDP